MQSTFPSTMADSMSGDELSLHLGRQVALQNEKYKEPEPAVEKVYNNYNWFSDLSRTRGWQLKQMLFMRKTSLFQES